MHDYYFVTFFRSTSFNQINLTKNQNCWFVALAFLVPLVLDLFYYFYRVFASIWAQYWLKMFYIILRRLHLCLNLFSPVCAPKGSLLQYVHLFCPLRHRPMSHAKLFSNFSSLFSPTLLHCHKKCTDPNNGSTIIEVFPA